MGGASPFHSQAATRGETRTAQAPHLPSPPPPSLQLGEQASGLCREYIFWREEMQGVECFFNRKGEETPRYHQRPVVDGTNIRDEALLHTMIRASGAAPRAFVRLPGVSHRVPGKVAPC